MLMLLLFLLALVGVPVGIFLALRFRPELFTDNRRTIGGCLVVWMTICTFLLHWGV